MDYRDPDWLSAKLGIEKNTVYRFLQDGTIPAIQIGRKWLISEARVVEWLAVETERQTRERREAARSADVAVRRMDIFTADVRQALRRAHSEARAQSHEQLDPLHVLYGLAVNGKSAAGRALRALAITPQAISRAMEQLPRGDSPPARRLGRNPSAKRALKLAARMAMRDGDGSLLSPIGTDHLLTGVFLARQGCGHELLAAAGVDRRRLSAALESGRSPNHEGVES